MEITKKFEIEKVVSHTCDVCGKSCLIDDIDDEFATLSATWGFYSNYDLYAHECHLCEGCYERVKAFIESLGGKIRSSSYAPFGAKYESIPTK